MLITPICASFFFSSTCLYFGFDGLPPITAPVLILNGDQNQDSLSQDEDEDEDEVEDSSRRRKNKQVVMNNVCFPSQV
jgi:hypothetical protein